MIRYKRRAPRKPRPALTLAEFIAAASSAPAPTRSLRRGEAVNVSALARRHA